MSLLPRESDFNLPDIVFIITNRCILFMHALDPLLFSLMESELAYLCNCFVLFLSLPLPSLLPLGQNGIYESVLHFTHAPSVPSN